MNTKHSHLQINNLVRNRFCNTSSNLSVGSLVQFTLGSLPHLFTAATLSLTSTLLVQYLLLLCQFFVRVSSSLNCSIAFHWYYLLPGFCLPTLHSYATLHYQFCHHRLPYYFRLNSSILDSSHTQSLFWYSLNT